MSQTGWDVLARMMKEQNGSYDELGVPVNASTVRGLPAMWYSLSRIAGHIGALPCNLYHRKENEDARIAKEHPAHWLVKTQPNPLMTASVFRETVQQHAILHGNGRAAIFRNGRGEPDELVILQPAQWAIVVKGNQKYHVRVDNPAVYLNDRDCIHVMGLSDDGIGGLSLIDVTREALGLAVAQQRRAIYSERNGARVKFFLKAPPGVFRKAEEAQQFIDQFNDEHSGPEHADKIALLREGIEAQVVSQTNTEAQAIEGRTFSRQDIGLLTGVEQMLGDDSSVSYNSLEMKNQAYLTNCLMRWLVRWQEECAAKLLTTAERYSEEWYFRFVTAALLRGTTKERFDVYNIGRQIGVFSANEVRELEDMSQRTDDDGNRYDNPAITPGKPAGTKPADPQPDKQQAMAARLGAIVRANVQRLASVERNSIVRAAEKERNFCGWVDEFYTTWTVKLGDAVADIQAPRQLAETWTAESKERLLAVAGRVSDSTGLVSAVSAELAGWREREEQLASAIITEAV